jgi:hypothetical protein
MSGNIWICQSQIPLREGTGSAWKKTKEFYIVVTKLRKYCRLTNPRFPRVAPATRLAGYLVGFRARLTSSSPVRSSQEQLAGMAEISTKGPHSPSPFIHLTPSPSPSNDPLRFVFLNEKDQTPKYPPPWDAQTRTDAAS